MIIPLVISELAPILKPDGEIEEATRPGEWPVDDRSLREKFIDTIKPFEMQDWKEGKWYARLYIVVKVSEVLS